MSGTRVRAPALTNGIRTSETRFNMALDIVLGSGVVEPIQAKVDFAIGRPRSLSVLGYLVALQINGLRRNHRGILQDVSLIITGFTPSQRRRLGIGPWDPEQAYDRLDRLFNIINDSLQQTWTASIDGRVVLIDENWFMDQLIGATTRDLPEKSSAVAVDGTFVASWGTTWELDDPKGSGSRRARHMLERPNARTITTSDDRTVVTTEPDARFGQRSATKTRSAGTDFGYELHIGVLTREITWTNGVDRLTPGPEVPNAIVKARIVPASSRRDDAIVPALVEAKQGGLDIEEVVWDRGYSQLRPEKTTLPLQRAGIQTTFRPMRDQRGIRPFTPDAIFVEGQLYSAFLPEELRRELPMPPSNATEEELREYEAPFNLRARYRYQRLAGPDADGYTRWQCPFHAGLLRSRALPWTMRRSRKAPLVELPDGAVCCHGTITVSSRELEHWQPITPGTTAWRHSMNRRQVVESANAALKGDFVDINRKFLRVLGLAKITHLLAFTLAGYNVERIRSFEAKREVERAQPARRARRRKETFHDLLGAPHLEPRGPPNGSPP